MTTLPHHDTHFSLHLDGLPDDTFSVVQFTGTEALNSCYHFMLTLTASRHCNPADVLAGKAALQLKKGQEERTIHGVPLLFRYIGEHSQRPHYQLLLGPRLERLKYVRSNRVFINKSIKTCISEVIQQNNIDSSSFEFRLEKDYPLREFICQYEEDDYSFIARWLEYYGMTYFFDQSGYAEKIIITDSMIARQAAPGLDPLPYAPQSGLEQSFRNSVVTRCTCKTSLGPQSARIRDFNYRKPDVFFQGQATVSDSGKGQVYSYSEDLVSQAEADLLARVRAEEIACGLRLFQGDSSSSLIQTGFQMTLRDHFNNAFNRDFLVTSLTHTGRQNYEGTSGLGAASLGELQSGYTNRFEAIPADTSFRPVRKTVLPRIHGTLHARIDAKGSGKYAEVDSQGRYKVVLPFDISGATDGQASHWIRLAQPYVGKDFGFHFPLLKHTEIVLAYVDGNPDRPVIVGTLPNPQQKSSVTSGNNTQCVLRTAGQNQLQFENKEGSESLRMSSPSSSSTIHLGAAASGALAGITMRTQGNQQNTIGSNQKTSIGNNASKTVKGASSTSTTGADTFSLTGNDTRAYKQQYALITNGAATNNNTNSTIEVTPTDEEILTKAYEEYDACAIWGNTLVLYEACASSSKKTKDSEKNVKISCKMSSAKAVGASASLGIVKIGIVLLKFSAKAAEARVIAIRLDTFRKLKGLKIVAVDSGLVSLGFAKTKQDIDGCKINLKAAVKKGAAKFRKLFGLKVVASTNNNQI